MGQIPQDGENEQNVAYLFYLLKLYCDQMVWFFKFSQLFRRDFVLCILEILSFWEETKKGKSSKLNFQDDGHIGSGPAAHFYLQEGSIPTSKIKFWQSK